MVVIWFDAYKTAGTEAKGKKEVNRWQQLLDHEKSKKNNTGRFRNDRFVSES